VAGINDAWAGDNVGWIGKKVLCSRLATARKREIFLRSRSMWFFIQNNCTRIVEIVWTLSLVLLEIMGWKKEPVLCRCDSMMCALVDLTRGSQE
jgi:hypothetical protein